MFKGEEEFPNPRIGKLINTIKKILVSHQRGTSMSKEGNGLWAKFISESLQKDVGISYVRRCVRKVQEKVRRIYNKNTLIKFYLMSY